MDINQHGNESGDKKGEKLTLTILFTTIEAYHI